MSETLEQLIGQLEEKIHATMAAPSIGAAYEALQYVQSFVARKKKTLGPAGTSKAVFHGVQSLIKDSNGMDETAIATTAGSLLKWFIEDGAGKDYSFHLHTEQVNAGQYCDIQNLFNLLESLEVKTSGPIVDTIYNPLHVLITKAKVKRNSPLQKRLNKLEILFAEVLHKSKKWLGAFKSYVRLRDADKTAEVLRDWSLEGYPSERSLFFARGLLHLLAENKAPLANDLLHSCQAFVEDNINATPAKGGGPNSPSLAVWHLATILTDLVNFPPMPRVDRTKLFGLLYQRYAPLLHQLDPKLLELFLKAGEVHCNFRLEQDNTPNPMAMLQSLFTGAPPGQANAGAVAPRAPQGPQLGGMDLNTMMQMMQRLSALQK